MEFASESYQMVRTSQNLGFWSLSAKTQKVARKNPVKTSEQRRITKNYQAFVAQLSQSKPDQLLQLPEIAAIDLLESIETRFLHRFGEPPFNISHWDPSAEFHDAMLRHIQLPSLSSVINYHFSYTLHQGGRVIEALGGSPDTHGFLFSHSTTASIVSIVNWLAHRGVTALLVLCPAYFAVFHACERFGVRAEPLYMDRISDGFVTPADLIQDRNWETTALFISNPVYCTGVYLSEVTIGILKQILDQGGIIVADECLARPGRELCRQLGMFPNFVSVYSPHKSVCINGVKFSVTIFDKQYTTFFEQWSDVLVGGLGGSSIVALEHFLSENFQDCVTEFYSMIERERHVFHEICAQKDVAFDHQAEGHFVSCYFPELSAENAFSEAFLERMVNATAGSVIFGNRSRFNSNFGTTFRVNLARSGPHFSPTLHRLINFLNQEVRSAQC